MLLQPSWIEMLLISQKLKEICLFCILQLRFIDTVLERQPKLRRQRCIFTKERGTNTKAPNRFIQIEFVFLQWNDDLICFLCQGRTFSEQPRWTWTLPPGVIWWWASSLATAPSPHSAHLSLRPLTWWPTTRPMQLKRSLKLPLHCQGRN